MDMEFQGYIYHHNRKKKRMILQEQNFWYGIIALGLCLIILELNNEFWNINWLKGWFKFFSILSLGYVLWNKLSAMNKKEPLGGMLNGSLKITPELIEIDEKLYQINNISNLQISINNYSGELQGKPNYPGPWRSNGVGNKLSFVSDGIRVEKDFFIQSEKDFQKLMEIKQQINTIVTEVHL